MTDFACVNGGLTESTSAAKHGAAAACRVVLRNQLAGPAHRPCCGRVAGLTCTRGCGRQTPGRPACRGWTAVLGPLPQVARTRCSSQPPAAPITKMYDTHASELMGACAARSPYTAGATAGRAAQRLSLHGLGLRLVAGAADARTPLQRPRPLQLAGRSPSWTSSLGCLSPKHCKNCHSEGSGAPPFACSIVLRAGSLLPSYPWPPV